MLPISFSYVVGLDLVETLFLPVKVNFCDVKGLV